jgi:2-alkyl-3-oxoalkanoate reductase
MQTVLITGINGFIGSHIAERMIHKGYKVRGLIRKTSDLKFLLGLDINYFYGDITDIATLEAPLKDIDLVIHVAGLASDWGSYQKFYDINVQGTINLTLTAERNNVNRFVHISTVALHGFGHKEAVDETYPLANTIFHYNETKKEAERWLFEFAAQSDMEVTAVRPGNVFGPNDHTFIEKYLEALEEGKIALIDGGRRLTCPSYIENVVEGIFKAATVPAVDGEAFIITDGAVIDWKTFTHALTDEMGLKRPRLSVPFGFLYPVSFLMEMINKLLRLSAPPLLTRYRISNGGRDYYFSIEKAKQILGYKPIVDFKEAINRTVDWYRNR